MRYLGIVCWVLACGGKDEPDDTSSVTSDPSASTTNTTSGPTTSPSTGTACVAEDLNLEVGTDATHPTVVRVDFVFPEEGVSAELAWEEGDWSHRYTVPEPTPGAMTVQRPVRPGVTSELHLIVDTAGGSCTTSGSFKTSSYDDMPGLTSSWDDAAGQPPEYFLLPYEADGRPAQIGLFQSDGAMLWRVSSPGQVRTAKLDDTGLGVWVYEQADGLFEFGLEGTTSLQLIGWDGSVLQEQEVELGHHDWQLSGASGDLNILGREPMAAFEADCIGTVWGDVVVRIDRETGEREELWGSVADGFPTPMVPAACMEGRDEETHYSYLNGYEVHGDTRAASASGLVQALLIGAQDGTWYTLTRDPMVSDLTLIHDGTDLYDQLAVAPHSLECTEGMDWGLSSPADAITCVAFHRRAFGRGGVCNSADLFVVEPTELQARYLATFPPPSAVPDPSSGCTTTNSHGNAALIGEPGSDGHTRVAMWSANDGVLTVLDLNADDSGAGFALDYVLQPSAGSAWRGWFISAYATLGSGHDRGGD